MFAYSEDFVLNNVKAQEEIVMIGEQADIFSFRMNIGDKRDASGNKV